MARIRFPAEIDSVFIIFIQAVERNLSEHPLTPNLQPEGKVARMGADYSP
jgi:hypothetical protein